MIVYNHALLQSASTSNFGFIFGLVAFVTPTNTNKHILYIWSLPLQFSSPRQRSQIQLNRRLRWDQNPPDMNDYAPECLKAPTAGTFALSPPEPEQSCRKRPLQILKDEIPTKLPKHAPVVQKGLG